jgi:hypothetical protein
MIFSALHIPLLRVCGRSICKRLAERRRSTKPRGPLQSADAECRDCQKSLAWRRID